MDLFIDEDLCTQEETIKRLDFCKKCDNFSFNENNYTYCSESNCLINLIISIKYKKCPKGLW